MIKFVDFLSVLDIFQEVRVWYHGEIIYSDIGINFGLTLPSEVKDYCIVQLRSSNYGTRSTFLDIIVDDPK